MAGNRFSRFYGVLLFSGILLTACPAFCGNSQMLPPTPFSSLTPCAASATGLTASILAYSGSTTAEAGINCINGLTGNSNGDLTIGSGNLYSNVGSTFGGTTTFAAGGTTTFNNSPSFSYGATFGGATLFNGSSTFNNGLTVNNAGAVFNKGISVNNNGVTVDGAGPVMSADVTTLNALRNISGCATNQALTKTSVGFACVAVSVPQRFHPALQGSSSILMGQGLPVTIFLSLLQLQRHPSVREPMFCSLMERAITVCLCLQPVMRAVGSTASMAHVICHGDPAGIRATVRRIS